jgi:four helix bundle protein
LKLIKFIDSLSKNYTVEIMGKQLFRSGTSVLANYVEADSASSTKDFINFFTHSLKSANESKVWLALFRDSGKAEGKNISYLLSEIDEISKVIATSIITLKRRK